MLSILVSGNRTKNTKFQYSKLLCKCHFEVGEFLDAVLKYQHKLLILFANIAINTLSNKKKEGNYTFPMDI